MDKPDVIKYIEKKAGTVLKKLPLVEGGIFEKEEWGGTRGYALKEDGAVIALALDGIPGTYFNVQEVVSWLGSLERLSLRDTYYLDYSFLSELQGLTRLDLSNNQISDISFVSNLSSLITLDLSNNQISDISFLKNLSLLTTLILSNNKQIKNYSFVSNLSSLTTLYLSNNPISDISFLKNLSSLNSLNLSNNQISDISFLKNLFSLTTLNLTKNQISDISFVSNLSSLTTLYLSKNQISDISFLKNLSSLTTLNLSNNPISDISFLKNLSSLTRLILTNNQISDISFVSNLSSLTTLNLTNNQISDISFLKNLSSLTALDLSKNQISDISFLKNLSSLTTLILTNNQISHIPFVSNLSSLTTLNLSNNPISDISFLKNLSSLTALDLSNNKQIKDYSFVSNLSSLTTLILTNNPISDISFVSNLPSLTALDLSNNKQIKDYSFVSNLSSLTRLILSNNQISDISFVSNLSSLTRLILSNNQISDISFVSNLSSLNSLYLSNNQISDISFVSNLPSLTALDLSNNKEIKDYSFVSNLSSLTRLYLSNNQISDISFVSNLSSLNSLILTQNPIETPPPEVVNKGLTAIRNYFEQLAKQGSEKLFEAKILFVGEGGTGKTSLMMKLLNNSYKIPNKTDSTLGLVVMPGWTFSYFPDPDIDFKANLWDFGGQEIQYLTHQFFLTPRSLYVLLLDERRQHNNLDYWMNIINLLSNGSPVLIVQNKKNTASLKPFDLRKYQDAFPSLPMESQMLDLSKDEEKFQSLQITIQDQVSKLPHVGTELPRQWVVIREALDQLRRKPESNQDSNGKEGSRHYISYQEYLDICYENALKDEEDCLYLLQHLHDIGVVLHFQNDPSLFNLVILNPHWAVDAVYMILKNVDETEDAFGRFTRAHLDQLWKTEGYEKKIERNHLLSMMLKDRFELCYAVNSQDETEVYITPQLLSSIEPSYSWPNTTHRFLFRYAFMPKGILSRLIVRLHDWIYHENDIPIIWQDGMVLNHNGSQARVKENTLREDGLKMIEMEIHGPKLAGKQLLRSLRDELHLIHKKSFPKVNFEQMVPCDCEVCKDLEEPYFHPLSGLLGRYEKGKRFRECEISYDDVSIESLLGNVLFEEEYKLSEEDEIEAGQKESDGPFSHLKIFYSYSKKDIKLRDQLEDHLATLKRDYKIRTWYDREIVASEEWDQRIKDELRSADIVLFLVSASSLATEYIMEKELPIILERREAEECTFVPVILRPSEWGKEAFSKYQALPEKGRPVTKWTNRDDAWLSVVKGVRKAILEQGAKK